MQGIDWGQLGKSLIGQSDEQVLSRETDKYEGPGTKVKREGIEKIMDTIFRGGDDSGLQTKSQQQYVEDLKGEYGTALETIDPEIRQRLGLGGKGSITKDTGKVDLARKIKDAQVLEEVVRRAKGTRGIKPSDYSGTDSSVIERNISDATVDQSRTDTTSSPEWQRQETRYIDALNNSNRQFAATMALQTGQMALSNKRADNQMEIAQMQQQLQMRREDAKEARLDRKDRMAAIQQMMAGLAQMGASIAI